eukprot:m.52072 g.52072  ORF g.52072 m.52072 type:complete len:237 (-) comp10772_c0_seq1:1798-2508(-)
MATKPALAPKPDLAPKPVVSSPKPTPRKTTAQTPEKSSTGGDVAVQPKQLATTPEKETPAENSSPFGPRVTLKKAGPSVYAEFPEFSRKQIKEYQKEFNKYDCDPCDGFIDLMELKRMMEKLGAPQTHIGLKAMIAEVDDDGDGQLNFREFLMIYKKAAAGELKCEGLTVIAKSCNVAEEGVKGAKGFFEAKVAQLTHMDKAEREIKEEQEERKREAEEAAKRKAAFKAKMASFKK